MRCSLAVSSDPACHHPGFGSRRCRAQSGEGHGHGPAGQCCMTASSGMYQTQPDELRTGTQRRAPVTAQPHLTASVMLIVIAAGALHACWNAITKHMTDRLMAFALIGVTSTAGGGLALAAWGLPGRPAVP